MFFYGFACLIYSVLYGTDKILRLIELLSSNSFQYFECDGKFIPFQSYLFIKQTIIVITFGIYCCSFFSYLGESMYDDPFLL